MIKIENTDFVAKDGTVDTQRGIEAGHKARTEALQTGWAEVRSWLRDFGHHFAGRRP